MQFPDGLEICQNGYSRNLLGELHQADFDSFSRRRRKTRSRGVTDTLTWVCDASHYRALSDFHRKAGGQFFSIALPDWQGLSVTTARFNSPLTEKQVGDHVEVTATVFIPSPAVIPGDELDTWLLRLIGVTDDCFGEPIHYWVNINWGVLWNTGIKDSGFAVPVNQFVNHRWSDYWSNEP